MALNIGLFLVGFVGRSVGVDMDIGRLTTRQLCFQNAIEGCGGVLSYERTFA